MKNDEIIYETMAKFEPLTEEEQKLVLRLFVDMYLEMRSRLEEGKYTNKEVINANMTNYSMFIDFLIRPNEIFNSKKYLLDQAKKLVEKERLPKA